MQRLGRLPLRLLELDRSRGVIGSSCHAHNLIHDLPQDQHSKPIGAGHRGLSTSQVASHVPVMDAASSLEPLWMVLSPSQLGAALWEAGHAASGLPWWASIPATTIALRAMLLPLSLKAKTASANAVLLHSAVSQAGLISARMDAQDAKVLGRMELVKHIMQVLRAKHGVPGWGWYTTNVLAQVSVFASMSLALRQMGSALWPGLTSEGLFYFKDLTSPPVFLHPISTPHGTMGAVLPLAITLLYIRALDNSIASRAPGVNSALRLLTVPYYCVSLIQPHAVLLYWVTNVLAHQALQAATASGGVARMLKLPQLLQPAEPAAAPAAAADGSATPAAAAAAPAGGEDVVQAVMAADYSRDAAFLTALGTSYFKSKRSDAGKACLKLVVKQQAEAAAAEGGQQQAAAAAPAAIGDDFTAALQLGVQQGAFGSQEEAEAWVKELQGGQQQQQQQA